MSKYKENFNLYLERKKDTEGITLNSINERQIFISYLALNYELAGYRENAQQKIIEITNQLDLYKKILVNYLKSNGIGFWEEEYSKVTKTLLWDEFIESLEIMSLNDSSLNYKLLYLAIRNAGRKLNGEIISYSEERIGKINTEYKFIKANYKEILIEALQNKYETNSLLEELKIYNKDLYILLKKGIIKGIIKINDNKLDFPTSQNTLKTFFSVNKYTTWKTIRKNCLIGGNMLTLALGTTDDNTNTAPYKEFDNLMDF